MPFNHLHVHSEYSLLDGACRVRDLVARAKELGQSAIAITDHGVMYGAVNFYREAKDAGIKPIIGCEVYLAARTRFDKESGIDSERHHLVLLCKNDTGYRNLCHLVSASFTEGFYTRPRIDMDILAEYSEGLIALSACISGEIPKLILQGRHDDAVAKALQYREIFGDDGFYLELQDHGLDDQPAVTDGLLKIHRETGIPLVVTNDVHYIGRDDAEVQDVLMCIQTGKTVHDTDRMQFESQELYLKSEDEMRAKFPEYGEAFDNTVKIADMCNLDFEFGQLHLPEFNLPDGELDADEYLKKLCLEGFARLYGDNPDVQARLMSELTMVAEMGFTDYFLIVADFIAYAKSLDIPVGPGRGSAAGSVASYCLGITAVDPIKYGLYFERFLNPERISMPDIDIDFCERRRGEVIEYVKQKYGHDKVAQIVTFNTLKAKNAIRSVSKALALTFQEENELAKEIPNVLGIRLADALKSSNRMREWADNDTRIRRVIDVALAIEDMPKDSGTHAAGVVITKRPVREYVPLTLSKKDDSIATQYTMTTLEELGLLKMDFLGLRNLTVIDDAICTIRKAEPEFDIEKIPEDDAETFAMLSAGRTAGVFQMESAGITNVCTGLGPKSIEDITAIIALYRPGPMDSIPRFLRNNREPNLITYKHPMLEPILGVTYGCIVYQEQVIEIFRRLAGFSLGQADMIRRAMSKKKASEIEREKVSFIDGDESRGIVGAVANGVPRDVASSIYDEIFDFANYAFNKSHAVAYAMVSYQTAYLKCHYPREYIAALLSSVLFFPEKVSEYMEECRFLGIRLLPPDINESGAYFSVSGGDIRYGLVAIKNIGRGFIAELLRERESGGPFQDFEEFVRRLYGGDLNRRALESLIKSGCFDGFGANRRQLMLVCQQVLDSVTEHRRKNVDGQIDLFGLSGDSDDTQPAPAGGLELPSVPEFSKTELLQYEREVTGLYLSGHPMDEYADVTAGGIKIGEILSDFASENGNTKFSDDQQVTICGILTVIKTKPTRNNSLMAYLTLEDSTGSIEMLAFQKVLDDYSRFLVENAPLRVTGRISARDEKEPQIMVNSVRGLTDTFDYLPEPETQRESISPSAAPREVQTLYVKLPSKDSLEYERLRLVLTMFPGRDRLVLHFSDIGKNVAASCTVHDALIAEMRELLGDSDVVVR